MRFIPNYSVVRLDRNRHGGGVLVYVHSSITYNVLLCGHANLELIVVSLLINNFKLCLSVFYRPHPPISLLVDSLHVLIWFLYLISIGFPHVLSFPSLPTLIILDFWLT